MTVQRTGGRAVLYAFFARVHGLHRPTTFMLVFGGLILGGLIFSGLTFSGMWTMFTPGLFPLFLPSSRPDAALLERVIVR